MHLSDEQFEAILGGEQADHPHLRQCRACRGRLDEMRAVRGRLRRAFASVRPAGDLAERIRGHLAAGDEAAAAPHPRERARFIRLMPALAGAAAVVVIGVLVGVYFSTSGSSATAAVAELARIHADNVAEAEGFRPETDAARIVAHLASHAERGPEQPRVCRCSKLSGCAVVSFHGRKTATYCIDTPAGRISVVVAAETPEELGLSAMPSRNGMSVWSGSHQDDSVAATRSGERTYCVIGKLPVEELADLLTWAAPLRAGQRRAVCPFCGGH
jgi:hypothetical protein